MLSTADKIVLLIAAVAAAAISVQSYCKKRADKKEEARQADLERRFGISRSVSSAASKNITEGKTRCNLKAFPVTPRPAPPKPMAVAAKKEDFDAKEET